MKFHEYKTLWEEVRGNLLLSANPTLVADRNAYSGPARPEILRFVPVPHLQRSWTCWGLASGRRIL